MQIHTEGTFVTTTKQVTLRSGTGVLPIGSKVYIRSIVKPDQQTGAGPSYWCLSPGSAKPTLIGADALHDRDELGESLPDREAVIRMVSSALVAHNQGEGFHITEATASKFPGTIDCTAIADGGQKFTFQIILGEPREENN